MASYPGDPRARPEQAVCLIPATGAIKRKRDALLNKKAVYWLTSNSHDTGTHHVIDALDDQLHTMFHRYAIPVVKHFPEQYLIFFSDSRAYHRVLHHRGVHHRGRTFNFKQWTERRGAVVSKLEFHVRLRIEGMPVHAWSEEVAAKIIGPHCAIHYVEGSSRRQDRTRTYDLWAWCFNPSKIPKRVLLIITDPDSQNAAADSFNYYHNPPRGYKGAYDYKLHIHLDVVDDLSFSAGHNWGGGWKPRREFLWNYGAPDSLGERRRGQGHDDRAGCEYWPRRDRDNHNHDDNFHRGTRHHRNQSSWGRVTRCRGAVDDCYSSNRYRGGNHGRDGRRSRALVPAQSNKTWCRKSGTKHVSFANPLVHILGHTSKERRILDMLEAAPGWASSHSPIGNGGGGIPTQQDDFTPPGMVKQVCSPVSAFISASPAPSLSELLTVERNTIYTQAECSSPHTEQPSPQSAQQNSAENNQNARASHTVVVPEIPTNTEGAGNATHPENIEPPESTETAAPTDGIEAQVDDLSAFINFISKVPPAPILSTPPRANPIQTPDTKNETAIIQRKSTRLAEKAKQHPCQDSTQLAQRVLANKLGELSPQKSAHANSDFNHLTQHLPKPLTSMKMAAIQTLVEKGNQPKSKKRSKVTPVEVEGPAAVGGIEAQAA
ncbi:unnamed protein product [Urochloa humidicola]